MMAENEKEKTYHGLLRVSGYLFFSISFGIIFTLIVSNINNIVQEKKLKEAARKEIESVALVFRQSVKDPLPETVAAFVKNYIETVRQERLAAVDIDEEDKQSGELKYLFTFNEGPERLDVFIKRSYLKRTAYAIDPPELMEGFIITLIVFISIFFYSERKRQTLAIWNLYKTETAELTKSLQEHEALALLGRMTSTLAHELKTPIATLSNLVQALPSRIKDEKFTSRFTSIAREEISRTQQLIDNLLIYGKEIPHINDEIIAFRPLMDELAGKNNLKVFSCPVLEISGDRFFIRLLFDNILRNSAQAGSRFVNIKAHKSPLDEAYEVLIEDDGAGYPAEANLSELLNPFVTSRSRGAGLGLFLVRKIAAAHGGDIALFRPDKGAGIKLSLPLKRIKF